MTALNTDPTASPAFVSIAQDPDKSPGWNVVTLADGTVAKFAGFGQRIIDGVIVQYIELNTPDLQDTFAGPVITPEIAKAIEAVGGELPPIQAPVTLKPDVPVVTPPPSLPPIPVPLSNPPTGSTPAAHLSWIQKVRAELDDLEAWVKKHV